MYFERVKGFTLIELMMTTVVIAILLTIGVPSFKSIIQNSRITTANNNLVTSLNLARSEAVKRGIQITVCASSNGTSCNETAWELGWIVFTDLNKSKSIDGDDTILQVTPKTGGGITVTAGAPIISYTNSGALASACPDCIEGQVDNALAYLPDFTDRILAVLSPISSAHASSGSSGSGKSGASGKSGGSGSSGSGSSGSTKAQCTAPGRADSGSSGSSKSSGSSGSSKSSGSSGSSKSSGSSGSSKSSGSSGSSKSSGSSGSSKSSGSSGSSKSSGTSGSTSTGSCSGPGIPPGGLTPGDFFVCDASRSNERGSFIQVTPTGLITRLDVTCN